MLVNVIALTISCTIFSIAADSGIVNMALCTLTPSSGINAYNYYDCVTPGINMHLSQKQQLDWWLYVATFILVAHGFSMLS